MTCDREFRVRGKVKDEKLSNGDFGFRIRIRSLGNVKFRSFFSEKSTDQKIRSGKGKIQKLQSQKKKIRKNKQIAVEYEKLNKIARITIKFRLSLSRVSKIPASAPIRGSFWETFVKTPTWDF